MKLQHAAVVTASLLSCAPGDEQGRRPTSMVTDSAGATIVLNTAPHFASLGLEESLRIGRVDGEGPDLFSGVIPVALDSAGNIFVGNRGSTTTRVFNRQGEFLTEFGGRGEGPAEITALERVIVGRDTIVMVDVQRRIKVVLFTPAGEFIDSRVVPIVDGVRLVPIIQSTRGWIWARVVEQIPRIPPSASRDLIAEFVVSGYEAPEKAQPAYKAASATFYGTASGPSPGLFMQVSSIGFDKNGMMYVTDRTAYSIDVVQNHKLVRSIRRDIKPRVITKEDVELLRAEVIGVIDTLSTMPDALRAGERRSIAERHDEKAALPLPEVVSPTRMILVSLDGSFWVQREPESLARSEAERMFNTFEVPSQPSTWDLFDREGSLVGSVVLPARFRPDVVSGRSVVGVFADEYDVEFVVRYEVVEKNTNVATSRTTGNQAAGWGGATVHDSRVPLRHPAERRQLLNRVR